MGLSLGGGGGLTNWRAITGGRLISGGGAYNWGATTGGRLISGGL